MRFIFRFFAALAALGVAAPAFADYVIAPYGGDITGARLSARLAQGDVTLTAASGDLVVLDTVNWNAHTLTLSAPAGSVNVDAVMTASGSAGLSLETAASAADGGVAMALTAGGFTGRVDFTGTGQSYRVNGTAYALIHTLAELEAIRPPSNGTITGAYALAADVDWSGATSQTPLGFLGGSGRFDGLGHQLLDLVIAGSVDDTGLFSYNSGGVIRNVGVRGGSVSGGGWVGALVGDNFGVIAHVYSTAAVSGTLFVGGLVGFHNGSGSLIADAWASGNVTGTGAVGGLVGTTQSGGAVNNVWASGNVTGQDSIGGLVGVTQTNATASETLRNAYATGNVTGSIQVGGLVGHNMSPVEHVFATGSVSASSNSYVGGLVGLNDAGPGGSVSDGWFASDTAGAHPDNGVGTAISLANLVSALPGSFDAAVWDNQNGKTTPYLKSLPGAVYVQAESASAASALLYTPVTTLDQLQAINANLAGNFALFNDIDATATSGWNGGEGFVPIGDCSGGFNGRFDGLGHVVVDPTINPGSSGLCAGLFGAIGIGSVVRNVGVDGGSVSGYYAVGGLVGYSDDGSISNAFATANVSGTNYGGGLVGFSTGSIDYAYATGSVTVANDGAGGLLGGTLGGSLDHAWASGRVSGAGSKVGGLLGDSGDQSTVSNSYWDSFSTGQNSATGAGGIGTVTNVSAVTSDPAQSGAANYAFKQSAYSNLGASTCLYEVCKTSDNAWVVFNGYTRPFLQMEYATTIDTMHQLQLMNLVLGASYVLGGPYTLLGNLDASETGRNDGTAANSNGMWAQTGFFTIGSDGNDFSGSLDGQYHFIANLTINQPDGGRIGLFGKATGMVLQNLALRNVSVTGGMWVGALVGYSLDGSISDVYVSGSVSGGNTVGGLVGRSSSSISNAYVTGSVTASDSYVGGLVGTNYGAISNTYAIASLSGINAGALVSANADQHGGSIAHSFWNTDVSFQGIVTSDSLAGLTGGAAADAKGLSSVQWLSQGPIATGLWDTSATWVAGYPYPVLKGFPYVLVTASGVTATYGSSTPTVAAYTSLDRYGTSVALGGTLAWFDDPQRAAGTAVNIGGKGASVPFPYQLTYIAAPQPTVSPIGQTLTFGAQASQTYSAGGTFAINPLATTNGDSPIVYSSTTLAVCTLSGTTVTIVSRGTCTIAANTGASPSGNYAMAVEVTQNVAIGLAAQTITFPPQAAQTYVSGGTFAINPPATTDGDSPIVYSSKTTPVCTVSATTVTIVSAGTCTLAANTGASASGNYAAATEATQNVAIGLAAQTITFPDPGTQMLTNGTFTITADTDSGLQAAFSTSTGSVCSISSTSFAAPTAMATVTMRAAGICTLTASQAGDVGHAAATPVTHNVTIAKKSTTLTLSGPASAQPGQQLQIVATVAGDPPSGTVLFCDGALSGGTCTGTLLCAPAVTLVAGTTSSTATCSTTLATPGTHSIAAYYAGDAAFQPVVTTVPLLVVVTAAPPATTAVPAPASNLWSLLLIGVLMAGIGIASTGRASVR